MNPGEGSHMRAVQDVVHDLGEPMPAHILLVDDDALLRRSLAFNLEKAGYRVSTSASGEDALALARRTPPDLVLLDIGLPGMDGLDALRGFQTAIDVPVVFLTARRRELDQVLGLELGADDYITKPFDLDVLLARVKAVLRRSPRDRGAAPVPEPVTVGDLRIDPRAHAVTMAMTLSARATPCQIPLPLASQIRHR